MLVYKIHNVNTLKQAQPIINELKRFNKGKSAIWLPEEWAHLEALGDYEPVTVIYVRNQGKPINATKDPKLLYDFLKTAYDNLGGESFLSEDNVFIPDGIVEIERFEKPVVRQESPKKGLTVFKVKTEGMSLSMAFDVVNAVQEMYDATNVYNKVNVPKEMLDKDKNEVLGKTIWIPDSLVDIEIL